MFHTRWAQSVGWRKQATLDGFGRSSLPRSAVQRVLNLCWQEHCVECSFPDCYSTCALYTERLDGNCARFAYGIYPNPEFRGHFEFGADILFRRWAKLEAVFDETTYPIPVLPHRVLELIGMLPLGLRNRIGTPRQRFGIPKLKHSCGVTIRLLAARATRPPMRVFARSVFSTGCR